MKKNEHNAKTSIMTGATLAHMVQNAIEFVLSEKTLANLSQKSVTRKCRVLIMNHGFSMPKEETLERAVVRGLHKHDPEKFPAPQKHLKEVAKGFLSGLKSPLSSHKAKKANDKEKDKEKNASGKPRKNNLG